MGFDLGGRAASRAARQAAGADSNIPAEPQAGSQSLSRPDAAGDAEVCAPRSATPTRCVPSPTTSPGPPGRRRGGRSGTRWARPQMTSSASPIRQHHPAAREYDMLVSAGERLSMALLVMALADLGVDPRRSPAAGWGSSPTTTTPGQDPGGEGDACAGAGRRGGPGHGGVPGRLAARESRHWAGRPTPPQSRWPPSSTPTPARSTPTSPRFSPADPRICPKDHRIKPNSTSSRCWR